MPVPDRQRIEAYARFLRSYKETGCPWLGPGECEEVASIIESNLSEADRRVAFLEDALANAHRTFAAEIEALHRQIETAK